MRYRPEIDGLRAVAVVPVILFHAGFAWFSGGYVGVDVFFVISGYLITSLILAEMERGKFSIVTFYERRARRILPALVFVMAACIPFAWMWLMPTDLKDFAQSLVAVSGFSSNILFWRESGYFDTGAELKPLLHTWSLAVEEQYYLLYPVFLATMWRFGKRTIVTSLIVATALSLGLAHWAAYNQPSANFFLLPTRGWELLIGSFAAFHFNRNAPVSVSAGLAHALSMAGLGLIVLSVVAFDEQTPFPSLYALVPTVGTVLIILFSRPDTATWRLLSHRVLVGIGLASYSAYLWHQPILAFARQRMLFEPGAPLLAVLCLTTAPLAYFSWRYVEQPFRDRSAMDRRTIFSLALLVTVMFTGAGVAGHVSDGFAGRSAMKRVVTNVRTHLDVRCHADESRSAEQVSRGDICIQGGPAISMAVIGDSHAGAIFDELGTVLERSGVGFWAIADGYCAPLSDFNLDELGRACRPLVDATIQKILETDDIRTVILVAEWAYYAQGFRNDDRPRPVSYQGYLAKSPAENPGLFTAALAHTVALLQAAGRKVVIVESVPEFHVRVLPTIRKSQLFGIGSYVPTITRSEYTSRNREVDAAFGTLDGVTFVPTGSLFCDAERCWSVNDNGDILFSDGNHVTEYGARLIASEISHVLRAQ